MNIIANREIAICFNHNFEPHEVEKYFVNDSRWTPVDLILRDWLNNGTFNFCGLTQEEGYAALDFIKEHKAELIENNQVSRYGFNNFGIGLWNNYEFDTSH